VYIVTGMRALTLPLLALTTACVAGVGGESANPDAPPESETGFVAHERGLDYAWSRPSSPQALKNAGYTFVARYLSYDTSGKNLTAGEAQQLFGAGVDVVANWEWGASDALDGYQTGVAQAQKALQLAQQCGMPADRPIYFSVDFDASPDQQGAIDSYFDGVASVLGVDRTGAYGGYYVIQRLFDHGKITWGWQTYAWSGGQWDARAQLRQLENGVTVVGADSDIDEAETSDFGQWGPNTPPPAAAESAEGTQAFLEPGEQHYLTTTSGNLLHRWWDQTANQVQHDTWGSGVTGRPVTFTYGDEQHVFVRGASGSLEHWFYKPSLGLQHDTWASGLAADPAALIIGPYQDVWGTDGAGNLQHWWWGPSTSGVQHDTWGAGITGRPTIMLYGPQQHVFARGTGGTLEHFYWDPMTGLHHDTWGQGLATDPTAEPINDQQHVWAEDSAGATQHWYWDPAANAVQHDSW